MKKKTHRPFFIIFYIIAYLMMMPPFMYIANKPKVILGLPSFVAWLVLWGILITLALCLQYRLDVKSELEERSDHGE